jgi:hypothetical protein
MGARHGDVERAAYHSRSGGLAIPRLSPLRDAGFPKRGQPSYVEGVDGTRVRTRTSFCRGSGMDRVAT